MANFTVKVGGSYVKVWLSQDESFYYAWKGLLPADFKDRVRALAAQTTYRDRWPDEIGFVEPPLRGQPTHSGFFR